MACSEHRGDLTLLLEGWRNGEAGALDRLMEVVYPELRRIAGARMAGERPGHTLQPTALVHEAFLRLVELKRIEWKNREQFLALAATFMRRVLVEHARARKGPKRGGGALHVTLQEADEVAAVADAEVLDLDEALTKLEGEYPRKARVVELRCFGGMKVGEIADALGASVPTVERDWRFACAWLRRELEDAKGEA